MNINWILITERLPTEEKQYLVTWKQPHGSKPNYYLDLLWFSKNLYKVDEYEFANKKGISGFYGDDSEWGCYLDDNVIAWAEVEPYIV